MKRFLKRNYQYIIVAVLFVVCIGIALRHTRIRSVDDVRQEAVQLSRPEVRNSAEPQAESYIPEKPDGQTDTPEQGQIGTSAPDSQQTDASAKPSDSLSKQAGHSGEAAQSDSGRSGTTGKTGKSAKSVTKQEPSKQRTAKTKDNKTADSPSSKRKISDGKNKGQDQYHTDPVPSGKPEPVNQEDQSVNESNYFYVYLSIDVLTILDHMGDLKPGLEKYIPEDGWIIPKTKVLCYEGETAWDVMSRECKARGINVQSSYTQLYGSVYMDGINNIGEFSCGAESGWIYEVNGWIPNYASSRYVLVEGEYIRWRYSCAGFGSDLDGIR